MATTLTPSSDQAAELLQKLSLDSDAKAAESQHDSNQKVAVGSEGERSLSPILPSYIPDFVDPTGWYLPNAYHSPFYYGEGAGNEYGEYAQYGNTNGADMTSGLYGYSPMFGPQHYPYPYFPPMTPTNGSLNPNQLASSHEKLSTAVAFDQKLLPAETTKGDSGIVNSGGLKLKKSSTPYKPLYKSSTYNAYGRSSLSGIIPGCYQNSRNGTAGLYKGSDITSPYPKVYNVSSGRNYNLYQNSNFKGLPYSAPLSGVRSTGGFMSGLYPNGFGYSGYDSRTNMQKWVDVEYKDKARGRYHNWSVDGLNELNRGPRAKDFKNQKRTEPAALAVKGQVLLHGGTIDGKEEAPLLLHRTLFNKTDFPVDYSNAKFFIIKSYSEDDVHKSIKYSVWSSTQNGNKKLDAAYKEAQQNSEGCPVFLLFSVNSSWQFVGLAQMVGPVDFDKSVEHWQRDKWTGSYPVKWHIVKDVPNNLLKHIILENNENKPVTNSRDTQEVKLEQGLNMIKIFKEHSSETCLLDDFAFYDKREKVIKDNKAWQHQQQLQKKVVEQKFNKVVLKNNDVAKLNDDMVPNKHAAPEKTALANEITDGF